MISILKTHLIDIQQHSIAAYPYECCGAMLGVIDQKTQQKVTHKLVEINNTSTENQRRRFAISTADYQALEQHAEECQLSVLGFYHSHPNHPAIPSETDLNFAWPFFSYIIQSIYDKVPKDVYSYELDVDIHQFKEEKLMIGDQNE